MKSICGTVVYLLFHRCFFLYFIGASYETKNTLRAAADVKYTMILAIVSMWTFRIGFSYILGSYLKWGVFGIWVAMTIDWLFRSICFTIRYLGGKWKHASLV